MESASKKFRSKFRNLVGKEDRLGRVRQLRLWQSSCDEAKQLEQRLGVGML